MKRIRFDRPVQATKAPSNLPAPSHLKEPWVKRTIQIAVLFTLVLLGGYWFATAFTYREYRAIVVGDKSQILTPEGGWVKDLFVQDQSPFLQSAPLIELEYPVLSLRKQWLEQDVLELENAAFATESEGLAKLRADLERSKAAKAAAESEELAAQEKAAATEEIVRRTRKLFVSGAATASTLDARGSDLQAAVLGLSASKKKYLEASLDEEAASADLQRALQSGTPEKRSENKTIREKRALIDEIKKRESHMKIRALRNGIVARRLVLPGDRVESGQPLVDVVYEGNLWIEAFIDPKDFAHIRPGTQVMIKAGNALEIPLSGVVLSLSPDTQTIPPSHRDPREPLEQYIVARIPIDMEQAAEAKLTIGQAVTVQISRW